MEKTFLGLRRQREQTLAGTGWQWGPARTGPSAITQKHPQPLMPTLNSNPDLLPPGGWSSSPQRTRSGGHGLAGRLRAAVLADGTKASENSRSAAGADGGREVAVGRWGINPAACLGPTLGRGGQPRQQQGPGLCSGSLFSMQRRGLTFPCQIPNSESWSPEPQSSAPFAPVTYRSASAWRCLDSAGRMGTAAAVPEGTPSWEAAPGGSGDAQRHSRRRKALRKSGLRQ